MGKNHTPIVYLLNYNIGCRFIDPSKAAIDSSEATPVTEIFPWNTGEPNWLFRHKWQN